MHGRPTLVWMEKLVVRLWNGFELRPLPVGSKGGGRQRVACTKVVSELGALVS